VRFHLGVTSTARTVEADSHAMRPNLLSIAMFALTAVVVGCSSSSGDSGGATDSGSAYDGPYDDIFTGRPDSPSPDTTPDAVAETAKDAGPDAAPETSGDAETDADADVVSDDADAAEGD